MKKKHIWKCKSCGARIKALGIVIFKPKKCPSCKSKEFE